MCGICGYVNFREESDDGRVIDSMVETIKHRGPDDRGSYIFPFNNSLVALGQSRLSIIDLSQLAHQPMLYKKLSIVYNGEVYNYLSVRKELTELGHVFLSNSDTEVILHAFEEWGPKCVNKFIGMFAFAILDSAIGKLYLFRDRVGIKPLYYYQDNNVFIFASELKAFHKHPLFKKELDMASVQLYHKYNYIPTPYCVFKHTKKVSQGSYLELDLSSHLLKTNFYWRLLDFYSLPKRTDISFEDATLKVENILKSAFSYRLIADVPVGVFLSAGVDSSCVAALLQSQMMTKLKTFTIGFESGNNEAPLAKLIAARLGTEHTEYYCTTKEALDLVEKLPYYFDEPFADSSAIPTSLVSKIARRDVTVVLSADGGDEIFAGYDSYDYYMRAYSVLENVPKALFPLFGSLCSVFSKCLNAGKKKWSVEILEDIFKEKNRGCLDDSIVKALYCTDNMCCNISHFNHESAPYNSVYENEFPSINGTLSKILFKDYFQYLQDNTMVKVDRASMSVSLESREPFLDHRIIEYVAQLPDTYKFYEGCHKRILRTILYKYLPKSIVDRPKSGFTVPLSLWLRGDLSFLVEDLLSNSNVLNVGVFSADYVSFVKNAFNRGQYGSDRKLWNLLMFYYWYRTWF